MGLKKTISTSDLAKKNEQSQAARDAEKRGTTTTGQQKTGR